MTTKLVMVKDNLPSSEWRKREFLADLGESIERRYVCRERHTSNSHKSCGWEHMRNLTGEEWSFELPNWIREKIPEYALFDREFESLSKFIMGGFSWDSNHVFWEQVERAAAGKRDWPLSDAQIFYNKWKGKKITRKSYARGEWVELVGISRNLKKVEAEDKKGNRFFMNDYEGWFQCKKTLRKYIDGHGMPDEHKKLFIKNCEYDLDEPLNDDCYEWFAAKNTFNWERSKEGAAFWCDVMRHREYPPILTLEERVKRLEDKVL